MGVSRENQVHRVLTNKTAAGFIEWYRSFRQEPPEYTTFGLSILSLAAGKPELREKISHWYNELFEELRKADCPDALNMVLLLEGLFYLRHFHVDATIDGEIERLLKRMSQSL